MLFSLEGSVWNRERLGFWGVHGLLINPLEVLESCVLSHLIRLNHSLHNGVLHPVLPIGIEEASGLVL